MVRGLPYGIGAILLLGMGANLTNAAFGSWLPDVPQDLLPSGHVAAATALYCSAILISAPQWRPVVAGLGFVGVAAIGASALAAELSGLFGVIAGILITLVWACAAAILMARSPIAAKREELRPDTAAIGVLQAPEHPTLVLNLWDSEIFADSSPATVGHDVCSEMSESSSSTAKESLP